MYVRTGTCSDEDLQRYRAYQADAPITWNGRQYGCTVLEPFGPWKAVMVCAMRPEGSIPFHADKWEYETRYHIVLETNPYCWTCHDGIWQRLETGGIYQMDPRLEHASINFGDTERRHLIVDL